MSCSSALEAAGKFYRLRNADAASALLAQEPAAAVPQEAAEKRATLAQMEA